MRAVPLVVDEIDRPIANDLKCERDVPVPRVPSLADFHGRIVRVLRQSCKTLSTVLVTRLAFGRLGGALPRAWAFRGLGELSPDREQSCLGRLSASHLRRQGEAKDLLPDLALRFRISLAVVREDVSGLPLGVSIATRVFGVVAKVVTEE